MFKNILVPVDGSENAFEALKVAISLHNSLNAELYILSVYREHRLWSASVSMVIPELTGSTDDALNRRDGFLYALFVPDRGSTAFPLFEQPDLVKTYFVEE